MSAIAWLQTCSASTLIYGEPIVVKGDSPPTQPNFVLPAMTGTGQEDPSEPPTLSGRSRFGQATFAQPSGNDGDAPKNEPARAGGSAASWPVRFRQGDER
jgi:hypothetical protein